jgi:probable rRNA maturation factor
VKKMVEEEASTDRVGAGTGDGPATVVDLLDPGGLVNINAASWIAARLGDALRELEVGGEVRLKLVGDEEMRGANAEYHGQDSTTDVLTFDLSEGRGVLDADLLLCVGEACRQATARGIAVERELLLYALHGVLHCLGYDDHDEESARRMHAEEDRVLTAISVGPTYAAPPQSEGGEER